MEALRMVLRLNALSCLVFGVIFLIWPGSVASFLGTAPPLLFTVLGIGLTLNGAHLILASSRKELKSWEVRYFAAGDFLWAVASLVLIAMGWVVTTPAGIAAALVVGAGVAGLGAIQLRFLRATQAA